MIVMELSFSDGTAVILINSMYWITSVIISNLGTTPNRTTFWAQIQFE